MGGRETEEEAEQSEIRGFNITRNLGGIFHPNDWHPQYFKSLLPSKTFVSIDLGGHMGTVTDPNKTALGQFGPFDKLAALGVVHIQPSFEVHVQRQVTTAVSHGIIDDTMSVPRRIKALKVQLDQMQRGVAKVQSSGHKFQFLFDYYTNPDERKAAWYGDISHAKNYSSNDNVINDKITSAVLKVWE